MIRNEFEADNFYFDYHIKEKNDQKNYNQQITRMNEFYGFCF